MLKNISILIISLFIVLFSLELLVRTTWNLSRLPAFSEPHFGIKWALKKNDKHQMTTSRQEFNLPFETNRKRLRGREISYLKDSNEFRVLIIGDSQVFGWGVQEKETLSSHLERLLNNYKQFDLPKFKVINAGLPGTGTYDQLMFLKKEGIKYQPDLVILCFNINDWISMGNHQYKDIEFDKNKNMLTASGFHYSEYKDSFSMALIRSIFNAIPFYDYLNKQSSLLNLIRWKIQILAEKKQSIKDNKLFSMLKSNNLTSVILHDEDINMDIEISAPNSGKLALSIYVYALMARMASYLESINKEFFIVVIPQSTEIIGNMPVRNYSFTGVNNTKLKSLYLGYPFLEIENNNLSYLWYPHDSHLSSTGHLAAGYHIALSIVDLFYNNTKFNKQKMKEYFDNLMALKRKKLINQLTIVEDFPELHFYKGSVLKNNLNKNNISEVVSEFKRAVDLNMLEGWSRNMAYYLLGKYERAMGKFDNAILHLQQASDSPKLLLGEIYSELGLCWLAKKDFGKAEKYFKESIELNPPIAASYYGIGQIYLEKMLYSKAIEYFNKADLRKPNYPTITKALDYAILKSRAGNS